MLLKGKGKIARLLSLSWRIGFCYLRNNLKCIRIKSRKWRRSMKCMRGKGSTIAHAAFQKYQGTTAVKI
jgi:hypothetical protein